MNNMNMNMNRNMNMNTNSYGLNNNMNFNNFNNPNMNINNSGFSKPQEKIKLNYGNLQKKEDDEFVEVEDSSKGKGGFNGILDSNFVDLKNLKKNNK